MRRLGSCTYHAHAHAHARAHARAHAHAHAHARAHACAHATRGREDDQFYNASHSAESRTSFYEGVEGGFDYYCVSPTDLYLASFYWCIMLVSGAAGGPIEYGRFTTSEQVLNRRTVAGRRVLQCCTASAQPSTALLHRRCHTHGSRRDARRTPPRVTCTERSTLIAASPHIWQVVFTWMVVFGSLMWSELIGTFAAVFSNLNPVIIIATSIITTSTITITITITSY